MVTHTYLIYQQSGVNKNKKKIIYDLLMRKGFIDHLNWIRVTEEHFHK